MEPGIVVAGTAATVTLEDTTAPCFLKTSTWWLRRLTQPALRSFGLLLSRGGKRVLAYLADFNQLMFFPLRPSTTHLMHSHHGPQHHSHKPD